MSRSEADLVEEFPNPYQAPKFPAIDDFIPYEPIRRPMIYTIAGSLAWFFAALILVAFCINIPFLMEIATKIDVANLWSTRSGRMITALIAGSMIVAPSFACSGYYFLKGRGRPGLCFGMLALALGALISRLTEAR